MHFSPFSSYNRYFPCILDFIFPYVCKGLKGRTYHDCLTKTYLLFHSLHNTSGSSLVLIIHEMQSNVDGMPVDGAHYLFA
jgi:hypothetical protein